MRRKTDLERELKALLLYVCPYLTGPQVEVEGIPTPTRHSSQARDSILFQAFSAPEDCLLVSNPKTGLVGRSPVCVVLEPERERYSIFENSWFPRFL